MDRNKIIIIVVLAVIVVVYIVFVVYGSVTHDGKGKDQRRSSGENYQPSPAVKNFGSLMGDWFGRFLPKTELPDCPNKPENGSELLCKNLANVELTIPPGSATFRVVKVILASGNNNPAEIKYRDFKDEAASEKLFPDGQGFKLPDDKHKGVTEENIIILKEGGKLKITCPVNSNCRVNLQ